MGAYPGSSVGPECNHGCPRRGRRGSGIHRGAAARDGAERRGEMLALRVGVMRAQARTLAATQRRDRTSGGTALPTPRLRASASAGKPPGCGGCQSSCRRVHAPRLLPSAQGSPGCILSAAKTSPHPLPRVWPPWDVFLTPQTGAVQEPQEQSDWHPQIGCVWCSKESACNAKTWVQSLAWEDPQGQRGLGGCSPWGRKKLDMTERLSLSFSFKKVFWWLGPERICLQHGTPGFDP